MLKSDLEIEPYTMAETLACLNKEFRIIKRREIGMGHLYNVIYNKLKIPIVRIPKKPVMIQYNSIVDIYNHCIKSNEERYKCNGRGNKKVRIGHNS